MDSVSSHESEPSFDVLIDRYLANECSPGECVGVERWISERPERRPLMERLIEVRRQSGIRRDDSRVVNDAIRAFAERRDRMVVDRSRLSRISEESVTSDFDESERHPPRWSMLRFTSYGVAFALVLGMIVGAISMASRGSVGASFPTKVVAMREYVAPRGQEGVVMLPDGSRVILNSDSRLRVPATFGREQRAVFLDGEGHFTILSHTTKPFVVYASGVEVYELGTVFNVRAYRNENRVEVAVADGRVSVSAPETINSGRSVLASGDVAVVRMDGAATITRQTNVALFTGWTTGRLTFRDAPASEVLAHLGRWYNVEFRVNDPAIAQRRIDVTVLDRTWKPAALHILAVALDARVEQNGRIITFIGQE